jgi:hypothetical protein
MFCNVFIFRHVQSSKRSSLFSVPRHFEFADGEGPEEHHAVAHRAAEHLQPPAAQNAERVHHQVSSLVHVSVAAEKFSPLFFYSSCYHPTCKYPGGIRSHKLQSPRWEVPDDTTRPRNHGTIFNPSFM